MKRTRKSATRNRKSASPVNSGIRSNPSAQQGSGATGGGAREEWILAAAITIFLFAVYAFTAPRTVALEDDGLFIMASVNAGVAHPPGYPLYTILGYLFSLLPLPVDSTALQIHLLSGLLGAIACGVMFFLLRQLGLIRWFALAVALAYGVSEHFWAQAIIAEVYTLNALLCFSVLLFCFRAREKNANTTREIAFAAFFFGLGLANHWPLIVLASPAFLYLLLPQIRVILRGLPIFLGVALLPAMLLYSWMVWRSQQDGVISFYGPLQNFDAFWYYFSREGYGSVDFSESAKIFDKLLFIQDFFGEIFFLLSPIGLFLAMLGCYRLYRRQANDLLIVTGWIFFAHSLLLILVLGFDYEYLNRAVFRPYPLIAYAMMAVWAGHGLIWLWEEAQAKLLQRDADWSPGAAFNALPLLTLLIPAFVLLQNFTTNDRREDRFAEAYARVLLENLEENAVLYVTGDLPTAPVGYLHYAEGVRPDVTLMNTQGLVYPTRLFSPPVTKDFENGSIEDHVRETSEHRPVYFTANILEFPNPFGAVHYGLHEQVVRDAAATSMQLRFDQATDDYFEDLFNNSKPQKDRWNRHLHDRVMQQYGEYIGYMVLSGVSDPEWGSRAEAKVAAMQDQYFGLIGMSEMLIKHGDHEQLLQAQEWVVQADGLIGDTLSKEMRGRHYYRHGFIAYRLGNQQEALELFNRSLEVYDHSENPANEALELVMPTNTSTNANTGR
ncbi:MAG: glycosyltransferase family 117 protein [Pseudohongiellaceae bacterium]